ncbi:MAG: phytanoyl-CoA dioxygenase family protein, partial [Gemmatimonadetes bacterium]|nr:phytanoyl-CoA dioxygenase family protein [Gemmatimonadota bacterium]
MPLSVDIEEKFVFDLDGYIVIENVLSEGEVDELNAIADEKMKQIDGKYRSVG